MCCFSRRHCCEDRCGRVCRERDEFQRELLLNSRAVYKTVYIVENRAELELANESRVFSNPVFTQCRF